MAWNATASAAAAATLEVAAESLGGGGGGQSLGWLWQTVGATCCWALSDVICDACISKGLAPGSPDCKGIEGIAVPSVSAAEAVVPAVSTPKQDLRRRRRPEALTEARTGRPCKGTWDATHLRQSPLSASPHLRPRAASLLTDVPLMSPLPLSLGEADEDHGRHQLSAEQNALLSGCLSLCVVAFARGFPGFSADDPTGVLGDTQPMFSADLPCAMAALGGIFHFTAYLSTLCAFGSASSTVITPLMQLSAVWMLPFSSMAALLGFATFIRPVHLLSVLLICVGGFLPAADGSLSSLATGKFWSQKAVRYVVLGELLICCYNVILHQATFSGVTETLASGTGASVRFFLVSRAANGMTCMFLFLSVPSLRSHLFTLHKVGFRCLMVALLGECLSMLGVCLVTFSYSSFYEPSVVNAVEGGLQQLFNLLFAMISHRLLGLGNGVEQVSVKCVSLLLVVAGLILSTR